MRSTYEFTLTADEYVRCMKHGNKRIVDRMPWGWLAKILWVGVFIAAGFLVALSFDYLGGRYAMIAKPVFYASLMLIVMLALYPVVYIRGQRLLMRTPNFMTGTPRRIEIDEAGLTITQAHCVARHDWAGIEAIERVGDIVILYLDTIFCTPIPVSAFVDEAECRAFIDMGRARIAIRRHAVQTGQVSDDQSASIGTVAAGDDAQSGLRSDVQVDAQPGVTPDVRADASPGPMAATATADEAQLQADPQSLPQADVHPRQQAVPANRLSLFLANLGNALRLAFFFPVSEERFPVSWWQVAAFTFISIAIPPLFAFTLSDAAGEWQWYSLPGAMLHVGLSLIAVIVAGYVLGRAALIPRLLLASAMIVAVIDAAIYLTWGIASVGKLRLGSTLLSVYQYGPPLWWVLALAVYTARENRATALQFVASLIALATILAAPLALLEHDRSFWSPESTTSSGEERKPRKNPAAEDVLNAQPQLLARDLARIEPGRKGIADLFFVGMGGYASQDVFRKEVDAVETLFRERFDTAGHSIKLVNNTGTLLTAPFANRTNLRAALRRVAQQMNGDEDVLVLFLTSHGSENHEFSLDLWPLQFNKLNPSVLRELLDESGIKHRVVIVSACYSGGFVNALRNDNTLVVSASAPDRNSFGCSNEAEWTYFGKAYFDEALRTTYSFTEAFEKALPVIGEREKKEGYNPSLPQMALGPGIREKLESIESRLRAEGGIHHTPGR